MTSLIRPPTNAPRRHERQGERRPEDDRPRGPLLGRQVFLISFAGGFQTAGSTFFAQHFGVGDRRGAEKSAGQLLGFLTLLSVILGAIGYGLAPTVLRLIRAPQEIFPYPSLPWDLFALALQIQKLFHRFRAGEPMVPAPSSPSTLQMNRARSSLLRRYGQIATGC